MDGWREKEEEKKTLNFFFFCVCAERTTPLTSIGKRKKCPSLFCVGRARALKWGLESLAAFNWSEESHTRREKEKKKDKRLSEREEEKKVTHKKWPLCHWNVVAALNFFFIFLSCPFYFNFLSSSPRHTAAAPAVGQH
jgi:hypothetical protein